jgi:hypothetical protein
LLAKRRCSKRDGEGKGGNGEVQEAAQVKPKKAEPIDTELTFTVYVIPFVVTGEMVL